MSKYVEQINEYIIAHKDEMIEDIKTLCRINSERMPAEEGMPYGPGPCAALKAGLEICEKYGFKTKNYENYVGTADMTDLEPGLDILAHLDVVPAGEGWTETEPFEPVVKGDKFFGRGTADDKGPAMAGLYAMRAVKELGIPLKKNVRLILGTDEECGSSDIAYFFQKEKSAPMTFSPDASFPVINTEKGRLPGEFKGENPAYKPVEAAKKINWMKAGTKINVLPGKAQMCVTGYGVAELEVAEDKVTAETGVTFEMGETEEGLLITAVGKGAHAMEPFVGLNALTAMLLLICEIGDASTYITDTAKKLLSVFPHNDWRGEKVGVAMKDEISGELTIAFSMLDLTEERVSGTFDSRVPVCGSVENVLIPIKKALAEIGIELLNETMTKPHHVDEDSQFIRVLLDCYERATGNKGECESTGGGTYVHNIENGVAYGCSLPGTDNKMHGADEFAVVSELVLAAQIFADVIAELCGE